MNSTLAVIDQRRSTRAFSDQPVTQAEKEIILHSAFRAPTAGNLMLYSILEVADQGLKERLVETCDHQDFIAKAPYVLIFLADYQRWADIFSTSGVEQRCRAIDRPFRHPQEGDLLLACCDALIAAQNAVIAAESIGIGSCYIGDIIENYEIHRDLFALPRYVFPIAMLCFGHPAVEHRTPSRSPRFDPRFIIHTNRYQRLGEVELTEMVQSRQERFTAAPKQEDGPENFGQMIYFRKFGADFSLEMSRSVRAMLKNWSPGSNDEDE